MNPQKLIDRDINEIVVKCVEGDKSSDDMIKMEFVNKEMASLVFCNISDKKPIQRSDEQIGSEGSANPFSPKKSLCKSIVVNNLHTVNKENVLTSVDKQSPIMNVESHVSSITPTKMSTNTKEEIRIEKKILNVVSQWSVRKPAVDTNMGAVPKKSSTPHAYQFKDIYKRNRDKALRCRQEQEQKMREFHSRPVPNFNSLHHMEKKSAIPITCPDTPMVLKRSHQSLEEKHKKQLDEVQRLQLRQPKTKLNTVKILKSQQLVQKKEIAGCEQMPFNLNVEKRLKDRRRFDAEVQKTIELKQIQCRIYPS